MIRFDRCSTQRARTESSTYVPFCVLHGFFIDIFSFEDDFNGSLRAHHSDLSSWPGIVIVAFQVLEVIVILVLLLLLVY